MGEKSTKMGHSGHFRGMKRPNSVIFEVGSLAERSDPGPKKSSPQKFKSSQNWINSSPIGEIFGVQSGKQYTQYKQYTVQTVQQVFILQSIQTKSGPKNGRPDLEGILTRKKVSIRVLETRDHYHWMPVRYGILIYVSHLRSSSLPWWATCRGTPWCPWPRPPRSSAGQRTRPQVWHINQDAILDRHSMVMVPGL